VRNTILQGTGDDEYIVDGKKAKFTGVIPNLLQRKYVYLPQLV
jgi:hypothetical protein